VEPTTSFGSRLASPSMQQLLLGQESRGAYSEGRRLSFPRLRGGDEGLDAAATLVGFCLGFLFIMFNICVSSLDPNEYGLIRNFITGGIGYEVERGGIHLTGPFKGFVKFPAAQLNLEFSRGSTERLPIVTRTGADPKDPDSGGQPIQISCAIQIKLLAPSLHDVYLAFGSYEAARQRFLLLAGNVVSNTAQDFVPADFWSRRDIIADKMLHKINHTLWHQGSVVAVRFEIMKVDFAQKFEESITQIQVAEQSKVVNEYEQQVQGVVQSIEVMKSENLAAIANISAGADATAKEIRASAKRDAFNLKQGMKAKKYAQLQKRLEFNAEEMQEFFKVHVLQSQGSGKVVIGMPGISDSTARKPKALNGEL